PLGPTSFTPFPYPCAILPDSTGFSNLGFYPSSISDNFNRANGTIGSNWLNQWGSLDVSSNVAVGHNATAWNASYWSAQPFPAGTGQYATATLTAIGSDKIALFVNMSGGAVGSQTATTGYSCLESTTLLSIQIGLIGTVVNQVSIKPA